MVHVANSLSTQQNYQNRALGQDQDVMARLGMLRVPALIGAFAERIAREAEEEARRAREQEEKRRQEEMRQAKTYDDKRVAGQRTAGEKEVAKADIGKEHARRGRNPGATPEEKYQYELRKSQGEEVV